MAVDSPDETPLAAAADRPSSDQSTAAKYAEAYTPHHLQSYSPSSPTAPASHPPPAQSPSTEYWSRPTSSDYATVRESHSAAQFPTGHQTQKPACTHRTSDSPASAPSSPHPRRSTSPAHTAPSPAPSDHPICHRAANGHTS